MDWGTFWAVAIGALASILTTGVAHWFQARQAAEARGHELERDEQAREAERKQDRAEYERRLRDDTHERVRAEAATIVRAVATADRVVAVVNTRKKGDGSFERSKDLIEEGEIGEWGQAVADANASALALTMIDRGLGERAMQVVSEIRTTEPGEHMHFVDHYLDEFLELVRDFLAPPGGVPAGQPVAD